ncbi:hypothetical protein BV20DRAFT_981702 [Pilatotrama ljubarskyi]|nr:hypothetical protein BV20DRAFT_981702 [Pilatotrama ljubarskyi]
MTPKSVTVRDLTHTHTHAATLPKPAELLPIHNMTETNTFHEDKQDKLHNGWGSLFADVNDEDDLDYDPCSEYDSNCLSDESDWNPVPIKNELPSPPIQLQRMCAMHKPLDSVSKLVYIRKILEYMKSLNMNLPIFLDALSWRDDVCISDLKLCYKRTTRTAELDDGSISETPDFGLVLSRPPPYGFRAPSAGHWAPYVRPTPAVRHRADIKHLPM